MINKKKRYVASFKDEISAALCYDKIALQYHGYRAKTNYDYSEEEIKQILSEKKDLNFLK